MIFNLLYYKLLLAKQKILQISKQTKKGILLEWKKRVFDINTVLRIQIYESRYKIFDMTTSYMYMN